jgi:cytochrome c553
MKSIRHFRSAENQKEFACTYNGWMRSERKTRLMHCPFLLIILAVGLGGVFHGPPVIGEPLDTSERSVAQLYAKYCMSFHGIDGRSKTMKSRLKYHARDLTNRNWQESVSNERSLNSIMNGRGKMPGFEKKISEQEIDSLVAYVRSLRK